MHATPPELLAAVSDLDQLAAFATPTDHPRITGALLRLAVAGDDLTEFLPTETAAAAAAVGRIEEELQGASERVDGYLAGGITAPAAVLRRACIDLAVYGLLGDRDARDNGPFAGIVRRGRDALDVLKALRKGDVNYGTAGAVATTTPDPVVYQATERLVTMDTLAGM